MRELGRSGASLRLAYVLPIRSRALETASELIELTGYLRRLAAHVPVIVVDGSPPDVFDAHASAWASFVRHLPPDPDPAVLNGKVGGVLTGLRRAPHDKLVVADDDVRYDVDGLARMAALLDVADVVRPQNYFDPLPWHARWDTARSLLNRAFSADWPGTLGVRRSALMAAGGYATDVLFENLEMVRTVRAVGGRELVASDLFVRRLPPTARHFRSQRVRQAYDEFARPARLGIELGLLPLAARLVRRRRWTWLALGLAGSIAAAEAGRRRAQGRTVFAPSSALFAPAWLAERAVCSWLALGQRLLRGGVGYGDRVLRHAATPQRDLDRRHAAVRNSRPPPPSQEAVRHALQAR